MSNELDKKLKTALNETRLLILGAQVLLGFQFQAFFQDGFSELSQHSRYLSLFGLLSIVLAVTFLIVPSMADFYVEDPIAFQDLDPQPLDRSGFTNRGCPELT